MPENVDKTNTQTKPEIVIEQAKTEPIEITPYVDEMEIVDEPEETAKDDADEIVLDVDDDDDEPEQPKAEAKPVSKEQRKIQALKNQALKLQAEKAELEKKLADKKESEHKDSLVKKYVDRGLDETEAAEKADLDIRQSNMEKQLAFLLFEKQNRKVLDKYPDADLEKIMSASKGSGMTVEQVCRGLYGAEVPEREKRAVQALVGDDGATAANSSVSQSMRSATTPVKSSLTDKQLAAKRYIEKTFNNGKPITDADFLKSYPS